MIPKQGNGGGMIAPPRIDTRDLAALIDQMKEMVPFYTPEWRFAPEDPDAGTALFFIVAQMLQENIKRLNRVPLKQFIAFMNMIDVSLIPAQPASSFLTFTLNEGTEQPVLVAKGTQVAAAAAGGEEKIMFETESGLLVTPATLLSLYNACAKQDVIVPLSDNYAAEAVSGGEAGTVASMPLFAMDASRNVQAHVVYIKHDDLFLLENGAILSLEWGNSKQRYKEHLIGELLGNPQRIEWSYSVADGWRAFDEVRWAESRLSLVKKEQVAVAETEVHGVRGRWIRARLLPDVPEALELLNGDVEVDFLRLTAEHGQADGKDGIAPAMLFYNDIELERQGFMPFGDHFLPMTSFYLACPEVLSKKEGWISLSFGVKAIPHPLRTGPEPEINWKMIMKRSDFIKKEPPRIWIQQVLWEYWNGSGWVKLDCEGESEGVFSGISVNESRQVNIRFRCPKQLEQTFVNSHYSHWIRARIMTVDPIYDVETVYMSPWLEQVSLTYAYSDVALPAEKLITVNNLEISDRTLQSKQAGEVFRPFFGLESPFPALYFGFDRPPVKGPISLYFALEQQRYTRENPPMIRWEYRHAVEGRPQWSPLMVIDDTRGFTQSGTVRFSGPPDFDETLLFGNSRCWMRAVNVDRAFERADQPIPRARRIYQNTVKAIQQESIRNEAPEQQGDEWQLSHSPVFGEELWVDETGHLTESEIVQLESAAPAEIDVIRDSNDQVQRVWIKWTPVESLLDSAYNDRHYTINRSAGTFAFGDGMHGMKPPHFGADKLKVHYKVTQGDKGNLPARQINELQNAIAFINSVFNPEPSGGGAGTETLVDALRRGPQTLKHQQRAVTASDFEWLARQAYPNIAKVKCLGNYNARMEREVGAITLVVLPKDGLAGQIYFPELKRRVEKYLLERSPGTAAFPQNIQVIEPAYLEISIHVTVTVESLEDVIPAEIECVDKLSAFLDPFAGHYHGKGWEIGEPIHLSVFYALLKSVHSIVNVERLYMTVHKIEDGIRTEVNANRFGTIPHGIVMNGTHKISVLVR